MHKKYRRQDRDPGWLGHIPARWCSDICTSTRKTCQHKPYIVAEVPHIKCLHLIIDCIEASTCTRYSFAHMNVHNSISWTVQLALVTVLMLGYLCDNIGLVLACLPSGSTNVTASPSQYMLQAIRDPYLVSCTFYACWQSLYSPFLNSKNFWFTCLASFFSFIQRGIATLSIYAQVYIYYPNPLLLPLLHPYFYQLLQWWLVSSIYIKLWRCILSSSNVMTVSNVNVYLHHQSYILSLHRVSLLYTFQFLR